MKRPGLAGSIARPALLAALLITLACWLLRRQQPYNLTVSLAPNVGSAYLELAATRKLGVPYGLNLQTLQRDDASQVLQDYLNGTAQAISLSGAQALWICHQHPQRCPQLVLVLDSSNGGDSLLVLRELVDLQGLRGQRVGISPQDDGLWLLQQALASAGMALSDVQLVPTPSPEMPRLLGRRQLGGAVLAPPFRERSLMLGDSRSLFDSAASAAAPYTLLAVEPGYAQRHAASLQALVLAWQSAHLLAGRNPEQALPVLGWATRLSPSGFQRVDGGFQAFGLQAQARLLSPQGLVAVHLAALQRVSQTLGHLPREVVLPTVSADVVLGALRRQSSLSLPK